MPTGSPTVLALDASSGWCSAALLHRGALQLVVEQIGVGHSNRLLPMIDELLSQHGLRPGDCDAVAFGAGPGAFTGLRIACGVAQGLAFAAGIPVVPVDCIEATALCARRDAGLDPGAPARVAVVIDARMGEVYHGLHEAQAPFGRALLASPEAAAQALADRLQVTQVAQTVQAAQASGQDATRGAIGAVPLLLCAGDGFARFPEALAGLVAQASAVLPAAHARADAVALLGAQALAAGRAVAADQAAPRYVRDKVALDVDEQRALRQARGSS